MELSGDNEIYRFLVTYYLYQDQLSWSRTQIVVAVEGAIAAGAFSSKCSVLSVLALTLGTIVIGLIWRLIERDWQARDQNLPILDTAHKDRGIRMTPPGARWWQRGTWIIRILLGLIVIFNLAAAVWFAVQWYSGRPAG